MGLSSPTQTHLHGNSHFSVPWCTCTGRDIYNVISILWNIYLTNQWMSKSYNKDPLVSRCMFCCNRRKQSLFENLFFMQIYDFSSLWDIHAIFFGDSFSKNIYKRVRRCKVLKLDTLNMEVFKIKVKCIFLILLWSFYLSKDWTIWNWFDFFYSVRNRLERCGKPLYYLVKKSSLTL